jgi:high-affinity nickel permease
MRSDPIGLRQSIVVAVLIGELEALGLVGSNFGLEGKFWNFIDQTNDNFCCSDIRSSVSSSQAG